MVKRLSFFIVLCVMLMGSLATVPTTPAEANDLSSFCLDQPSGPGCEAGLPQVEYQLLLDEMMMHPKPKVRQIPVNMDVINRYAYRRLISPNGTTTYSSPGGAPNGSIDAGFTYVTVYGLQNGWVEIGPDQWVPENQTAVARPSTFSGVVIEDGQLDFPMAWVLQGTFPSPYPGGPADNNRVRLERYDRVNIFATREVDGWEWYLVGPDAWVIQTAVARVKFAERPEDVKGRWVGVDLFEQVLVAYDEDTPVFATLISSGLAQWSTNEGVFQTYWRLVNGYMTGAEGQTDYYLVDGVPYTMYFDESISLHGTYWHDNFGYRHSHGCVNMTIMDAQWVYNWTADGGFDYPSVYVFSTGEYING